MVLGVVRFRIVNCWFGLAGTVAFVTLVKVSAQNKTWVAGMASFGAVLSLVLLASFVTMQARRVQSPIQICHVRLVLFAPSPPDFGMHRSLMCLRCSSTDTRASPKCK